MDGDVVQADKHDSKGVVKYDPSSWQAKRERLEQQLQAAVDNGSDSTIARFILSCLGAIPVVGGAVSGAGGYWSENEQEKVNQLFLSWIKLQEDELKEIGQTLFEVIIRLDKDDPDVIKRIESPEYLSIIKKSLRNWSAAESEEKRQLIRNLLSNAGAATQLCTDDVIRLFIDWIDRYSEAHFKVIRVIYKNKGFTRQEIWNEIHGEQVRENSAEADLFKLLIDDLSQGRVIRQHRETDYSGRFVKPSSSKKSSGSSSYYASAFDNDKQYELTELGMQFVHYTMDEVVTKLSSGQ